MLRVPSTENISDVMERIVDRGIVVDPWTSICLRDPERLLRYHWVIELSAHHPELLDEGARAA